MEALKHNITIAVTTKGGQTFSVSDTDEKKNGTYALMQLEKGETIKIVADSNTTYIPFNAVDNAVVSKTVNTVDIEDDNCKTDEEETTDSEGGSDGTGE